MRKLISSLLALLPLCGCVDDYSGIYEASCGTTHSQAETIATDIFRGMGLTPILITDSDGRLATTMRIPSRTKPGETIDPHIQVLETDNGLIINIEDNGDGSTPLSKKMRDVIEQALRRNGCAPWKLNQQANSFNFAK